MKRRWLLFTALLVCIATPGCSVQKMAGKWRSDEKITIDGSDSEWSGEPQLDDAKRKMMVRLLNDASSIFLCVSFGDGELARQVQHDGLTIWVDPEGGKKRVFGIHLPGMRPHFPGMPPFRSDRQSKDTNPPAPPPMDSGKAPVAELESISITYADTTGPLKMDMDEVRKTGLDIGVGRGSDGRWIYEFDISLKADSCLANLGPGTVVGIAIQSGGAETGGEKPPSMGTYDGGMGGPGRGGGTSGPGGPGGGMGGGPPGGGMGGGPPGGGMGGGPPGGQDSNEFEIWIRATLGVGPMP